MIFKSLAVAALLMAFAQAPSGPRRQATNPLTAPTQNPAPAASVPQSAAGPAKQTPCSGGNCDEWPLHIKVANPPPAAAVWPLHDRIAWIASLVLVVLGYVGIMLALSLLKKIERQTRSGEQAAAAAAESARAALSHAQAIASAERPWILIAVEPSRTVKNGFVLMASNRGRTPARIIAVTEKIEVAKDETELPAHPQYPEEKSDIPFAPTILLPGESIEIKAFSREDVTDLCPSEEQLKRVEIWEEKIFLYGKLTYEDLITPQDNHAHQTAWCFWYIHGRQKSGLVPAGSREYNLHT